MSTRRILNVRSDPQMIDTLYNLLRLRRTPDRLLKSLIVEIEESGDVIVQETFRIAPEDLS